MRNVSILLSFLVSSVPALMAADNAQPVTVSSSLQIPGATLKAGSYLFSVDDRLPDRAIVRIANAQDTGEHYLVLTVPSATATAGTTSLVYFKTAADSKQVLKSWSCSDCSAPLEFVYPKLEAVKITDDSTEPVLAVDPSYDKLPENLTADDLKVVTLWLLSPERITADHVGQGVKAAKYSTGVSAPAAEQAAKATPPPAPVVATPSAAPVESASAAQEPARPAAAAARRHLPKTATNNGLLVLLGLGCLATALMVRIGRARLA